MRPLAVLLAGAALAASCTAGGINQKEQPRLDLLDLMTTDVFRACGLDRLDSGQLAALNQWLTGCVTGLLDDAAAKRAPDAKVSAAGGILGWDNLPRLAGCWIVASDGQPLGVISTNRFASESIANPYGDYGSRYASESIFNPYGTYGSKYSASSPFNQFTDSPPVIIGPDGEAVAYLTMNQTLAPRVDPRQLKAWLGVED